MDRQREEMDRHRQREEMDRQRHRQMELERQMEPDVADLAGQIHHLATQSGIPSTIERAREASKRVSTPQAGLNWLIDNL
jgi:hypothetical protein